MVAALRGSRSVKECLKETAKASAAARAATQAKEHSWLLASVAAAAGCVDARTNQKGNDFASLCVTTTMLPLLPEGGATKDEAELLKQSWHRPSAATVAIATRLHCNKRPLMANERKLVRVE